MQWTTVLWSPLLLGYGYYVKGGYIYSSKLHSCKTHPKFRPLDRVTSTNTECVLALLTIAYQYISSGHLHNILRDCSFRMRKVILWLLAPHLRVHAGYSRANSTVVFCTSRLCSMWCQRNTVLDVALLWVLNGQDSTQKLLLPNSKKITIATKINSKLPSTFERSSGHWMDAPVNRCTSEQVTSEPGEPCRWTSELVPVNQCTRAPGEPVNQCTRWTGEPVHQLNRWTSAPGEPVNRCTGEPVNQVNRWTRWTGEPVNRCTRWTGAPVHQVNRWTSASGEPVNQCTSESVHQYTSELVNQCTSEPVNRWTSAPVNRCTGPLVNRCTGPLVNRWTSEPGKPVHQWTSEPVQRWTSASVHQCTRWTSAPVNLCTGAPGEPAQPVHPGYQAILGSSCFSNSLC